MDQTTRQKICQLVAGIVITDDVLDEKEEAFVDRMIAKFGLSDTNRDVIFPLVDSAEAATEMRGLPKEAQDEAFRLLIEAACADGEVVAEERSYLSAVAEAIGIAESDVDQRLKAQLGS
ncbi:MAG TPA: TerB family tellurite resistance protein [Polyangiaceae bacterium]|jgi:uncharacterized tellurite resistance protein B-like protein|nr:TerB family tellurite resistance protein [Polyangiaceae bacterium]